MFISLLSVSAEQTHMIDADWLYQKRKQRLHVCTYPTCQLDLGVKNHVNKDILK